jgi:hypothetical protein
MKRQLAGLPESSIASYESAYEGFEAGMNVDVLFQVRAEGEGFGAVLALKFLFPAMNYQVSLQTGIVGKYFGAARERTWNSLVPV